MNSRPQENGCVGNGMRVQYNYLPNEDYSEIPRTRNADDQADRLYMLALSENLRRINAQGSTVNENIHLLNDYITSLNQRGFNDDRLQAPLSARLHAHSNSMLPDIENFNSRAPVSATDQSFTLDDLVRFYNQRNFDHRNMQVAQRGRRISSRHRPIRSDGNLNGIPVSRSEVFSSSNDLLAFENQRNFDHSRRLAAINERPPAYNNHSEVANFGNINRTPANEFLALNHGGVHPFSPTVGSRNFQSHNNQLMAEGGNLPDDRFHFETADSFASRNGPFTDHASYNNLNGDHRPISALGNFSCRPVSRTPMMDKNSFSRARQSPSGFSENASERPSLDSGLASGQIFSRGMLPGEDPFLSSIMFSRSLHTNGSSGDIETRFPLIPPEGDGTSHSINGGGWNVFDPGFDIAVQRGDEVQPTDQNGATASARPPEIFLSNCAGCAPEHAASLPSRNGAAANLPVKLPTSFVCYVANRCDSSKPESEGNDSSRPEEYTGPVNKYGPIARPLRGRSRDRAAGPERYPSRRLSFNQPHNSPFNGTNGHADSVASQDAAGRAGPDEAENPSSPAHEYSGSSQEISSENHSANNQLYSPRAMRQAADTLLMAFRNRNGSIDRGRNNDYRGANWFTARLIPRFPSGHNGAFWEDDDHYEDYHQQGATAEMISDCTGIFRYMELNIALIGKVGETCAICLDELEELDIMRQLQCLHYFHLKCIEPWLSRQKTCPLCRECIDGHLVKQPNLQPW